MIEWRDSDSTGEALVLGVSGLGLVWVGVETIVLVAGAGLLLWAGGLLLR